MHILEILELKFVHDAFVSPFKDLWLQMDGIAMKC